MQKFVKYQYHVFTFFATLSSAVIPPPQLDFSQTQKQLRHICRSIKHLEYITNTPKYITLANALIFCPKYRIGIGMSFHFYPSFYIIKW